MAAERVAENIIEDLFTCVLDWALADLNNQIGYADILLSRLGIKCLLIEAQRLGALAWNRRAVEWALDQALRYAAEPRVRSIAVSDSVTLYTADIEAGGLRERVLASLQSSTPPETLWWLSLHGIYRPRVDKEGAALDLLPKQPAEPTALPPLTIDTLLHPKYAVPVECVAYVGNAAKPGTWKLSYHLINGETDVKRLPKATQSILSNYRGAKVSSVPEAAIPDVLVRLAREAVTLGGMPVQSGETAEAYVQLEASLLQIARLDEVTHS